MRSRQPQPVVIRALLLVALAGLTAAPLRAAEVAADAIVAADGTGKFKTVQDAVNAAPQLSGGDRPWTILIKPGTYRELVYIQREKRFISLVGESPVPAAAPRGGWPRPCPG